MGGARVFGLLELVVDVGQVYEWYRQRRFRRGLRAAHPEISHGNWRRVKYCTEEHFRGWFQEFGEAQGTVAVANDRILFWPDDRYETAPALVFTPADSMVRSGVKGSGFGGNAWVEIEQQGARHYFQPKSFLGQQAATQDLFDRLRAVLPKNEQTA